MKAPVRNLAILGITLALVLPASGLATNGMNMEGYGPVACGMGGASFAYDNGTAALMNNPATLGLAPAGTMRLDLALGMLGPRVDATVQTPDGGLSSESLATAFYMPAGGWVRRDSKLFYGFGIFGQGGMGTEYGSDSWMSDPSQGNNSALEQGMVNRTEIGVGRAIVPLGYAVSDKFTVAGSADFVWASMDLQMAMSESQFVDMVTTQTIGTASGTMVDGFGQMYEPAGGTGIQSLYHAAFDFSNDNAMLGEAKGYGFAGKIGATYQVDDKWTLGAVYQSTTKLGDLETDNATVEMGVSIDTGIAQGGAPSGTYMDANIPVTGKISVENFQWPATVGGGVSFRSGPKLLLAMDVKLIQWGAVMDEFRMRFDASGDPQNGGFAGTYMETAMYQDWNDQAVLHLGGQYSPSERWDLRAGANIADNPVPDNFLNSLFPAIEKTHFSLGLGYSFSGASVVNASFMRAFNVEATNPGNGTTLPAVTTSHNQWNFALMYSHMF